VKALEITPGATVHEEDLASMLQKMRDLRAGGGEQITSAEVKCDACGGTTMFSGTLTSSECPYCGSPLERNKIHDSPKRVPVDGVLPFKVDKAAASRNLKEWVRSRWFAPNEFRRRGVEGVFNGVYLPYWTFDAMTAVAWSGERGEHYWVTVGSGQDQRKEQRTSWSRQSGSFQRFFDDVLVCAATGVPPGVMQKLEPWPLAACIPFNQQVLAGYLARTYDLTLDQGFAAGQRRIQAACEDESRGKIGGDEQRLSSCEVQYSALTYKHLLLPVWMLTYRFHGKPYQVVVNAGTGHVQGERPWSVVKIVFAALGVILATVMLALLFSAAGKH
jgi:hypothetical protein